MKKLNFTTTLLLALGMAGAAQAQATSQDNSKVAPATIVLAQCDEHRTTPCGIDGAAPAEKVASDRDPEAPVNNAPKNRQANDPVAEVPEPQTFVMLMLGLVILGFSSRKGDASDKFTE